MLHIWKHSCKSKHTSVPFLYVTERPRCHLFKSKANSPPCTWRTDLTHLTSPPFWFRFLPFSQDAGRSLNELFQSIYVPPSVTEIFPKSSLCLSAVEELPLSETAFVCHFSSEVGAMEAVSLVTSFLHQHLLHHQPSAPTVSHELQTLHQRNYVELEAALIYVAIQIAL